MRCWNSQNDIFGTACTQGIPRISGNVIGISRRFISYTSVVSRHDNNDRRKSHNLIQSQRHCSMTVICSSKLLPNILEWSFQRPSHIRIRSSTIHNHIPTVQRTLRNIQFMHFTHIIRSHLSTQPSPLTKVYRLEMDSVESRTFHILGKNHGTRMKTGIHSSQCHGTGSSPLSFGIVLAREAQTKLWLGNDILAMHLFPEGSLFVLHSHDSIRQLSNEQASNGHLTPKRQFKSKLRSIHRINMIHVQTIILLLTQGRIMQSTGITQVHTLIGTPRTPFSITHANPTLSFSVHTRTISLHTLVTRQGTECLGLGLLKIRVGVVHVPASLAFLAWKGGDARSGIDNNSLTLGSGCAHP
mmetsp:Transcript_2703/g.6205  ORF Transcript_2703/g.6205 Transcript_2703/m.6205 type:complete len:356 (+) Transcript_2703:613-1680(+)